MTPTAPGRYRFRDLFGNERIVKVIDQNGELYAVGLSTLFVAAPVAAVVGEWLGPA
ncbi:MAG: hypothetical protein AB7G13_28675 [Lautropia sp.]